jgi:hypothetical protein
VFQLFIELKKAYDSVRRAVLYHILIEFGILLKLVGLIKMCLTETHMYVKLQINKLETVMQVVGKRVQAIG